MRTRSDLRNKSDLPAVSTDPRNQNISGCEDTVMAGEQRQENSYKDENM